MLACHILVSVFENKDGRLVYFKRYMLILRCQSMVYVGLVDVN